MKGDFIVKAIWAQDESGLIGNGLHLPWSNPEDLKFFKETTTGSAVLMGYNTFASLGFKPLPNRKNIVLTHKPTVLVNGYDTVYIFSSIKDVLEKFADTDIYVIGGASIYDATIDYVDEIIRTTIHGEHSGNIYIPENLTDGFAVVATTEYPATDTSEARTVEVLTREKA